MKSRSIAIAVLVASLAACTQTFRKDDRSPLAQRDLQECEYEAAKAAANTTVLSGVHNDLKQKCLALRGYKIGYE